MKKFVISILILMFYCGCGEEKIEPQIDHTVDEEEIPNQESWNAEIFLTEEGKLRAIVFADHLKKRLPAAFLLQSRISRHSSFLGLESLPHQQCDLSAVLSSPHRIHNK